MPRCRRVQHGTQRGVQVRRVLHDGCDALGGAVRHTPCVETCSLLQRLGRPTRPRAVAGVTSADKSGRPSPSLLGSPSLLVISTTSPFRLSPPLDPAMPSSPRSVILSADSTSAAPSPPAHRAHRPRPASLPSFILPSEATFTSNLATPSDTPTALLSPPPQPAFVSLQQGPSSTGAADPAAVTVERAPRPTPLNLASISDAVDDMLLTRARHTRINWASVRLRWRTRRRAPANPFATNGSHSPMCVFELAHLLDS